METTYKTTPLAELRRIFWPIEWHEHKKFLPMVMMIFCIIFNYSMLRSIKDGFVITSIGVESISFLKTWFVFPSAVIIISIYLKLCNIMSQQRVFTILTLFFTLFFLTFAFILYPYPESLHPSAEIIEHLALEHPNIKWFIKIWGHWSFALFYIMAELYGMMMIILFWQFANQTTGTSEAKRFYPMYGILAIFPLEAAAFFIEYSIGSAISLNEKYSLIQVIWVIALVNLPLLFLYSWINKNVLNNKDVYNFTEKMDLLENEKLKLSFFDSFKTLFTSKYLALLAVLVISYSISTNLIEMLWKSKLAGAYNTVESYTMFMVSFLDYKNIPTILFIMIIATNIIRRVSWFTATLITPIFIFITGLVFFSLMLFDQTIGFYFASFFNTELIMLVVIIGAIQNIFLLPIKNSFFVPTKEMAYIPLNNEMKIKGKIAVDFIALALGKSAGSFLIAIFFIIFPTYTFTEATPYFAGIFFVVVILWIFAVYGLSKEYTAKIVGHC